MNTDKPATSVASKAAPLRERRTVDVKVSWSAEDGYKARMFHQGEHTDLDISAGTWHKLPEGFIPTEFLLYPDENDVLCVAIRKPGAEDGTGRQMKIGKGKNDNGKVWQRTWLIGPSHLGPRPKPNSKQKPMDLSREYSIALLKAEALKELRDKARRSRRRGRRK